MKRFFFIIAFILTGFICYSQTSAVYDCYEDFVPNGVSVYDGLYAVMSNRHAYLGTAYGITFANMDSNEVVLALTTNAVIPEYLVYTFKIDFNDVIDEEETFIIKNKEIEYIVRYEEDCVYVSLNCRIDSQRYVYAGSFYIIY